MNLFATVLTYPTPSANYRGESEQNRSVIQKITEDRLEYPVISPEAMRNALREILAGYGLPCNRSRLHDEEQLAVKFQKYPHPEKYIDDRLIGYMVAANSADRRKTKEDIIVNAEDCREAEPPLELRRRKKERNQIKENEAEKAKAKKKN